ncbi:MAG: Ig-like domain-containing protein, partial [Verrucomicrobiota bacterium]
DGNDSAGDPIDNGTFVMVMDLDGDGFNGTNYTGGSGPATSWLWDDDDMFMDRGPINDGEGFPFRQIWTEDIPETYDAGEDNYYLLWFDVPYDENADGPGDGVAYGVELLGTVGTDPGDYTPFADGGNATLQTGGGGGTNDAPSLEAIADQSVDEHNELTFAISASDADGDDLTLSATGLPEGEFFSTEPKASPATWNFSWTPAEDESGVYDSVEFTVSDGNLTDSETVTITVNEVNTAPVLDPIGDKTVTEDETLTFDVTATDADIPANTLAFSAANVPDGADFDGNTFTWTPTDGQGGNTYDITFTVTDDGDPVKEDSETITVTVDEPVNHAPVAEAPQGLIVEAEATLSIPLVAADEDAGDTVTLNIVDQPVNGSLGTIDQETQTVQYTADGPVGEDHFSFQATDGELDSEVVEVFVLVRSEDGWIVNLNLDGADFATLTLGADPEATDGHEDSFDELVPPTGTSSRSVEGNFAALYRPPFAEPQEYFRRDIRALDGDHTWVLELEVQDGNEPLTVSWDAEELPEDIVLALTECDEDGNPLDQNDSGTPMADQTEITATDQDGVLRYCIQPLEDEIEFELTLDAGAWNLISLPLTPNNPSVEDVFSDTNLVADGEQRTLSDGRRGALHSGKVWDWDEENQKYVAAEEIQAYQGYWVYIPEDQGGTITVAGQTAAAPTTLHKHWNLVGGDSEPTNADIALGSIWKWVNGQYAKVTTLVPGMGFWIYAFEDGASLQSNR